MLVFFLVCYFFLCICIYIINLCSLCSCKFIYWVRDVYFLLILVNLGVNLFVYVWWFENFRKVFVGFLISCGKCYEKCIILYEIEIGNIGMDVLSSVLK